MKKQFAFTLVELLVVIGIIALLAAILFPVFASARRKSYQTVCSSNLRQLGQAVLLYAHDYDDHYPLGGDTTDLLPTASWYHGKFAAKAVGLQPLTAMLFPYTKSREVWKCPADMGFEKAGPSLATELSAHPSAYQKFGMSYHYQTIIPFVDQTVSGIFAHDKPTRAKEYGPAQILLLWDAVGQWHGGAAHSDLRYNVLFCDGHVAPVSRTYADELWDQWIGP
jgi:prepilin-type N-terminal cleavage/methylation domain-containing protein/prepilin-type processing-associated H-X9-DG protein